MELTYIRDSPLNFSIYVRAWLNAQPLCQSISACPHSYCIFYFIISLANYPRIRQGFTSVPQSSKWLRKLLTLGCHTATYRFRRNFSFVFHTKNPLKNKLIGPNPMGLQDHCEVVVEGRDTQRSLILHFLLQKRDKLRSEMNGNVQIKPLERCLSKHPEND